MDDIHDTRKTSMYEAKERQGFKRKEKPPAETSMKEKLMELVSEIEADGGFKKCKHYASLFEKVKKQLENDKVV